MQSAFRAIISGRVQMVMYRDFVQRKAAGLGITGEVRNMPDNTVEVVAEGEKDALRDFITLLNTGPFLARIDDVALTWQEPRGRFSSFSIRY